MFSRYNRQASRWGAIDSYLVRQNQFSLKGVVPTMSAMLQRDYYKPNIKASLIVHEELKKVM